MKNKVISIWSPTSGLGTTFTAVNLALELSSMGLNTVLVDFDLKTPSVAMYLKDDDVIHCLDNVIPFTAGNNLTEKVMESNLQSFEKLNFLRGTNLPEQALYVRQDALAAIINLLKEMFEVVIIDTQSHIDNAGTYQALLQADTIFMVVDKNVFNIRQFENSRNIYTANFGMGKTRLVINKTQKDIYMDKTDIEQYFGLGNSYDLPYLGNEFINAANQGKWLKFMKKGKTAKKYKESLQDLIRKELELEGKTGISKSSLERNERRDLNGT